MPFISGGGGGGGPPAGSYLPVANTTGVTVDTTTYNDQIAGSGAKLTTLVYADDGATLAIAQLGDSFPRVVWGSNPLDDGIYLGDGSFSPFSAGFAIQTDHSGDLVLVGQTADSYVNFQAHLYLSAPAPGASFAPSLSQLSPKYSVTSGALSTVQLVSGTGAQILTTRDAETVTPCTFNPGAATTATVTVALSPDNVTYSTLAVVTEPAGVALDGTILPMKVRVPAGWYLKLTANAQAVLGLTTYY